MGTIARRMLEPEARSPRPGDELRASDSLAPAGRYATIPDLGAMVETWPQPNRTVPSLRS